MTRRTFRLLGRRPHASSETGVWRHSGPRPAARRNTSPLGRRLGPSCLPTLWAFFCLDRKKAYPVSHSLGLHYELSGLEPEVK